MVVRPVTSYLVTEGPAGFFVSEADPPLSKLLRARCASVFNESSRLAEQNE
jgi:hypothetical protein